MTNESIKKCALVGIVVVGLVIGSAPLIASAEASGDSDSVTVREVQTGSGGTGSQGGGGPTYVNCFKEDIVIAVAGAIWELWSGGDGHRSTSDPIAWQTCTNADTGEDASWVTGLDFPGEVVDPTPDLVAQARASIIIELPDVELSPPNGGTQLVGVPVWVWSTNNEPVSATASIPGLSATLTATPGDIQVDLGDGAGFTCDGAGIPYDRELSYKVQESDCAEAYADHGRYTLTVTVVWSLAWVATNGQSGTLPPITRTRALDLDVQQAQAVTD